MRVLAFDLATIVTGYAVLDAGPRYVEAGTLSAPAGWPVEKRMTSIGSDMRALLVEFKPDEVALETPFVHPKNGKKNAIQLGAIRGIALWLCYEASVPTHDYAPAEARAAIGCGGNATKAVVGLWVTKLLGLRKQPGPDAADALAVALAHLYKR